MIIDTHNHPDWYHMTMDRFLEDMEKTGIEKTWLLSCEIPEGDYNPYEAAIIPLFDQAKKNIPFERCVPYYEKHPDKFILGYAPDPHDPLALEKLTYAMKAYGVRVCGELKYRMMLDDYDAIRLYRFCGKNNLPVVVHIQKPVEHVGDKYPRDRWWYGGDIDSFERAIKACPETTFIGHAQSFWSEISGDGKGDTDLYPTGKIVEGGKLIKLLDTYPNLYCDISAGSGRNALTRDPEFAVKFLTKYADRILFARDSFGAKHKEVLLSYNLPQDVLDKIFYKNAQKLIGE
ncbi:MAG: amidohydrolase family protein [Clostridia bacterium]|nr:amidohydrolase family protein [Clostridia bacterium]